MNNEFIIKNMIADNMLYQLEQQNKETLKIYYANLEQENKQLKEEKDTLYNALITTRTKYNNDKARYRRKAKSNFRKKVE